MQRSVSSSLLLAPEVAPTVISLGRPLGDVYSFLIGLKV